MSDPVTNYAERIDRRELIAGPGIRAAAARHLRDLEAAGRPGPCGHLRWTPERFSEFEEFCSLYCLVRDHVNGGHVPLKLLPPQQFVMGSILGWSVAEGDPMKRLPGSRRFRTAYIESGKGMGKTPLGAALGLYLISSDRNPNTPYEPDAEGYIVAATEAQALITYRDMESMIGMSPVLDKYFQVFGGTVGGRVICQRTNSFFRTLGSHSQGVGRSGFRPHVLIVDEYHEHSTRHMLDMMDQGTKGRRQPLTLITTNAGLLPIGPCWDERQRALEVAHGTIDDDAYFSAIFCLDEEDDPWKDDACWVKSNPTLGVVIREDYLRAQMKKAEGMPDKRRDVDRLNFALWCGDAEQQFLGSDVWRAAEEELPEGMPDHGVSWGLDLAERDDLVALAAVWDDPEQPGTMRCKVRYWTPEGTLAYRDERSSGHLRLWAEEGFINTIPGDVVDFDFLARVLAEFAGPVQGLAPDPWRLKDLLRGFDSIGFEYWTKKNMDTPPGRGLAVWPHPQIYRQSGLDNGLWMPRSIDTLRDFIVAPEGGRRLKLEPNPVLRWNLISAVLVADSNSNRRFDKRKSLEKSRGKIDGLVALAMAAGLHEVIRIGDSENPISRYYAGQADAGEALEVWGV